MTQATSSNICRLLTVIDGATEEVIELFEIPNFDLAAFCTQFDVPIESDPEMRDSYVVGPDDAPFVCKALGRQLTFQFSKFGYFIDSALRD